jgi:hypothetical protein
MRRERAQAQGKVGGFHVHIQMQAQPMQATKPTGTREKGTGTGLWRRRGSPGAGSTRQKAAGTRRKETNNKPTKKKMKINCNTVALEKIVHC